jgi:hypothetical protein
MRKIKGLVRHSDASAFEGAIVCSYVQVEQDSFYLHSMYIILQLSCKGWTRKGGPRTESRDAATIQLIPRLTIVLIAFMDQKGISIERAGRPVHHRHQRAARRWCRHWIRRRGQQRCTMQANGQRKSTRRAQTNRSPAAFVGRTVPRGSWRPGMIWQCHFWMRKKLSVIR